MTLDPPYLSRDQLAALTQRHEHMLASAHASATFGRLRCVRCGREAARMWLVRHAQRIGMLRVVREFALCWNCARHYATAGRRT